LEKQKEELGETLRRQQQYQQSIRDISDRLDSCQCSLDALRLAIQSPMTANELSDKLHTAEVSHCLSLLMLIDKHIFLELCSHMCPVGLYAFCSMILAKGWQCSAACELTVSGIALFMHDVST